MVPMAINTTDPNPAKWKGVFNSSSLIINVLPEFTKRVYILNHITVGDLFTRIGGFRAALGPIFDILEPFFIIYFLNYLAEIIGE